MNNTVVTDELLGNYFSSLVNCFFKILPIREKDEDSLCVYMESLEAELLGCIDICKATGYDASFMSLISILRYLIINPTSSVKVVKREVFKAIGICNKLKKRYSTVKE